MNRVPRRWASLWGAISRWAAPGHAAKLPGLSASRAAAGACHGVHGARKRRGAGGGAGQQCHHPDALGPMSLEHLVVTRHLRKGFPQLRAVSAIAPGVLGTTGLESVEVVRGIVERAQPKCVVVVDALAARRLERVCTTVQLADTGLAPGSGVRNGRAAFTPETLGVPVIALGVPTVVDAATLLEDTVLSCGGTVGHAPLCDPSMVVSPKDIDARVGRMARLVGFGLSLGLHSSLTMEDISCLVG